jgi:phenylacetate-coenzyme A ligase PaaK-like adenylate-forming protein
MYRDLYDKANVKPDDIKSLDDFIDKIPTIDKPDVIRYQGHHPPFGDSVVRDSEDYFNFYFQTSGTTGTPLKEIGYYRDMVTNGWVFKWWAHGIRPRDIIYFAFLSAPFYGLGQEVRKAAGLPCIECYMRFADVNCASALWQLGDLDYQEYELEYDNEER